MFYIYNLREKNWHNSCRLLWEKWRKIELFTTVYRCGAWKYPWKQVN